MMQFALQYRLYIYAYNWRIYPHSMGMSSSPLPKAGIARHEKEGNMQLPFSPTMMPWFYPDADVCFSFVRQLNTCEIYCHLLHQ
jgi:hypothetical protein